MIRKLLLGRVIADFRQTEKGITLVMDDGRRVEITVGLEGGPGADHEWHQWAVLRVNGIKIARA